MPNLAEFGGPGVHRQPVFPGRGEPYLCVRNPDGSRNTHGLSTIRAGGIKAVAYFMGWILRQIARNEGRHPPVTQENSAAAHSWRADLVEAFLSGLRNRSFPWEADPPVYPDEENILSDESDLSI
jgi:hypothetical protein